MPQDDDRPEAEPPTLVEAGPHQRRADPGALARRRHRHRGEAHDPQRGMAREDDRREQDVSDDRAGGLRDERDDGMGLVAERAHQIGLGTGRERGLVHLPHRDPVSRLLGSDQHRGHGAGALISMLTISRSRSSYTCCTTRSALTWPARSRTT